ncbi:MAG: alkaline phosphatase family protein [Candidatus Promineifilaceae bacterium]
MDRTLLVGLDAACWEYLDPLLQAGQLPNLGELIGRGVRGVLRSTVPPWTPTAWATIVTGKNPGKHGVFDMLRRRPRSYEFTPTSALHRLGTPFWKRLNDSGVRVGLVNVPFTYPPNSIEGFMLCGFGSPESARNLAYPAEALGWVEDTFGPYKPVVAADVLRNGQPAEILAAEIGHQAQLVKIAAELAEKFAVDVLAINLMLTDHANHKMPHMHEVQAAYRQSDAHLAVLLEAFRPDNVMLISDHGSSRTQGDFLLGMWLRDQGYCVQQAKSAAQQSASLHWILTHWADYKGWSGVPKKVLRRIIREGLPKLPQGVQKRFWAKIEASLPFAQQHMLQSNQPDYSLTRVFPGSLYSGLIYFNVVGREPTGVIAADERSALSTELAGKLSEIQEPHGGKRLLSNVFNSAELYQGPATEQAPDLIVDGYLSGWNIRTRQPAPHVGRRHGHYFVTDAGRREFGWHSPDGVLVFAGSAFRTGKGQNSYQLIDVPATLLHLYGVPLPLDYDGHALLELLSPQLSQRTPRYQPGDADIASAGSDDYSPQESDLVTAHLRALGYLD